MSYTTENIVRVYDDLSGDYVQIRDNAEGEDLVGVTMHKKDGEVYSGRSGFDMTTEWAKKLHVALGQLLAKKEAP